MSEETVSIFSVKYPFINYIIKGVRMRIIQTEMESTLDCWKSMCNDDIAVINQAIQGLGSTDANWINIKRKKFGKWSKILSPLGSELTILEAANRLGSNVVIVNAIPQIFNRYKLEYLEVNFGNERENPFDITGWARNEWILAAEVFNVAPSFFQSKRNSSLKKLFDSRGIKHKAIVINANSGNTLVDQKIYRNKKSKVCISYDVFTVNGDNIDSASLHSASQRKAS